MAATYTYNDLLSMVKTFPRDQQNNLAPVLCNLATNLIWHAYDWRESISVLPPFYLIPGEQDHRLPPIIVPTNFHGFRKTDLARYTSGAIAKSPLEPIKDLALTHIQAPPTAISYEKSFEGFRLHPRVPFNIGSPTWFVEGTYKARPTKITNTTMDSTLPFDDQYLNVWVEALQWAYLKMSNSPSAGLAQINGPQTVFSGQLANAMAAIDVMAANEGLNDSDAQIAPSSPLVPGGLGIPYSFPSLFGTVG